MSPQRDDIFSPPSIDKQDHTLTFSNPVHEIQRSKDQIQATADHDLRTRRCLLVERGPFQVVEVSCYRNEWSALGAGRMKNVGLTGFIKGAPREAMMKFALGGVSANRGQINGTQHAIKVRACPH
jgi:hypothetical protein